MAGGTPSTFWEATPMEWRWMLEGFHRRRLYSMRELAQHYIWVRGLIAKGGPTRADQLVRDPDEERIYSSDFEDSKAFRAEIERRARKGGK